MDVIELLKKLLRFASVTPDDDGAFAFIREYMKDFTIKEINKNGVKNLFIYKTFSEGEHLCFAGHIDVVPPGEGWKSDPFDPIEKEGKLYARGTQDMKSGVAAFLKAVKEAKNFKGTLSLLLTNDEEGEAKYGTLEVLKHLKAENFLPDYAIVAEPTCEIEFGDAIKIGRRGSINGVLTLKGKQGHAAYPDKAINPVHQIAPILSHIAGYDLDNGDAHFSTSKLVITDIRGGMEVTNVTPGDLKIMFNVRNSTLTDQEKITAYIDEHFKSLDYTLTLSQSAKPFVTDPDTKVVKLIDEAILNITGKTPKHSTAGGTSDARFLADFGVKTIEFGVVNDTIHAPNERVGIDEVIALEKVFKEVIKKF